MSDPGAKAPAPYKMCDTHFAMNCPICKEVQPNPVSGDAMPIVAPVLEPEDAISAPKKEPKPIKPAFTDPKALAVLGASTRFAAAREAVGLIGDQMQSALETLNTLRQKDVEAQEELANAQKNLMETISGQS